MPRQGTSAPTHSQKIPAKKRRLSFVQGSQSPNDFLCCRWSEVSPIAESHGSLPKQTLGWFGEAFSEASEDSIPFGGWAVVGVIFSKGSKRESQHSTSRRRTPPPCS